MDVAKSVAGAKNKIREGNDFYLDASTVVVSGSEARIDLWVFPNGSKKRSHLTVSVDLQHLSDHGSKE